jgi:hypothetical protein
MLRKRKTRTAAGAPEQRKPARPEDPISRKGAQLTHFACKIPELVRDRRNPSQVKVWSGPGAVSDRSRRVGGHGYLSPGLLRFAQALALPNPKATGSLVAKSERMVEEGVPVRQVG